MQKVGVTSEQNVNCIIIYSVQMQIRVASKQNVNFIFILTIGTPLSSIYIYEKN